jgi:hypothetical protein
MSNLKCFKGFLFVGILALVIGGTQTTLSINIDIGE